MRNYLRPRNKYGNRKCEMDGHYFDSAAEMQRYAALRLLEQAGEILALTLQPRYTLMDGFRDRNGKWQRPLVYVADFSYADRDGNVIVEDVKGVVTKEFAIKEKLFRYKYDRHCDLRIVKVTNAR